jgi:ABC-type multidrug transport system fused ATPase/permease subunit
LKQLTLVAIGIGAVFGPVSFLQAKYIGKLTEKQLDALSLATDAAEEILSNIRTVHIFSAQQKEKLRYKK